MSRIRFAVFDYAKKGGEGLSKPMPRYLDRFNALQRDLKFPEGSDGNVVHLPDSLRVEDSFAESHAEIQSFWDEFIAKRGFEGLVMHSGDGEEYRSSSEIP